MSHTIPNLLDAAFAPQAKPGSTDWDGIVRALAQTGVKSGCAVSQRGAGANMSVDVAAGTIYAAGVEVAVTSGNVVVTTAHASLGRKDIVVASNAGVKSVTAGTAAVEPVAPAIPANAIILAEVYVPANDTAINTNQITDKRAIIQTPAAPAGTWTSITKSSDQVLANTITLTNDSQLFFTVAANTTYAIELYLLYSGSNATSDYKFGLTFPSSLFTGDINHISTADAQSISHIAGGIVATTSVASVSSQQLGTDGADTIRQVVMHFTLRVGGSGGTFQYQFAAASTTGGGSDTTRAGSVLRYLPL